MKIAILINLFPPKWLAGTEVATYNLAEHLAKRGHEIHVITSKDEGLPKECYEKGFYIHRLPNVRVRFVGKLVFWGAIFWSIFDIKPDVVHVQGIGIGIPALFISKLLRIPYVIYGRGSDVYLPDWFTKFTSKTIIANASSAIALTNDMKMVMQGIYDRDIAVVSNGIALCEYVNKFSVHKSEGLKKKILFVGRLQPVKGVQYLLQAMKLIHNEIPDAMLILIGDGDERNYLEDLTDRLGVRECVDFVGIVPHERIPEYMYQSDIFILSSLSEGFPVTVLEAMACSLPIVATKVNGLSDIIEDGVNGYLVEAKDIGEMADKIIILLKNPQIRNTMSENNLKKVLAFTWENVVSQLEHIYINIKNER